MMNKFLIAFLFLLNSTFIFSQHDLNSEVSPLSSVELLELPSLDNNSLKSLHPNQKGQALRFAEGREVNVVPSLTGNWEYTKSDKAVWRQRIKSPNAHTLNLGFTKFHLPESAVLFLYNPNQTSIIGPLTKADNDDHHQYWTPMIDGDEVVIELQVDIERKDKVRLQLSKVNHDFLDIRKSLSGSCNLDVVCGEDDGWGIVDNYRDIISSVGAYTIGGIDACSGALINNTRRDCTPYFLTADHCGISNSNSPSVVVYWNYQNSICRQPNSSESGGLGDGLRDQFNSGSRLRATVNFREGSDFTLIELDDELDSENTLFLAGWDRSGLLGDTSICIHHPGVEEKRISFDFDELSRAVGQEASRFLRVNNWEIGTTEGGSSGSPLFNANKQIIGQLFGGLASCSNNSIDDYGALAYSWDNFSDPSQSLSSWLDPDGIGNIAIDGMSCSFTIDLSVENLELCSNDQEDILIDIRSGEFFDNLVTYTIENIPEGIDAELRFEVGDPDQTNSLTLSNYENLTDSTYIINVIVSDGSNEATQELALRVYGNVPDVPDLISPVNGTTNTAINLTLRTEPQNSTQEYTFQLSTLPNFSDITSETTSSTEWTPNSLNPRTEYFWRVEASNPCGESDWSEVYSFFTSDIFCTNVSAKDLPLTITDTAPNTVTSTIDLPYPVTVSDVNITQVQGLHDFMEDLDCRLEHNGESVTLFANICFDNDDFDIGFDDSSMTSIPCPPTDGNIHQPLGPLSTFNGMSMHGVWNMVIEDSQFIDGGEFQSWSMELCYSGTMSPIIIPSDHDVILCDSGASIYSHYLPGEDNRLNIVDSRGNNIDFSIESDNSIEDFVNIIIEERLDPRDGPLTLSLIDQNNDIQFSTQVYLISCSSNTTPPIINIGDTTLDFIECDISNNPIEAQQKIDELINDPNSVTVFCDPVDNYRWVQVPDPLPSSPNIVNGPCDMAYDVLLSLIDACGNTDGSSVIVTVPVRDTEGPSVLDGYPIDQQYDCVSDVPPAQAVLEDACSGRLIGGVDFQIIEDLSGVNCESDGVIIREYYFEDPCGNVENNIASLPFVQTITLASNDLVWLDQAKLPDGISLELSELACSQEYCFQEVWVEDNTDPNSMTFPFAKDLVWGVDYGYTNGGCSGEPLEVTMDVGPCIFPGGDGNLIAVTYTVQNPCGEDLTHEFLIDISCGGCGNYDGDRCDFCEEGGPGSRCYTCDLNSIDVASCTPPWDGNSGQLGQPNPLCGGQGVPHNMSWYSFMAGSPSLTVTIIPVDCIMGNGAIGIQAGVYSECGGDCIAGDASCTGGLDIKIFTLETLVVGNIYYIFVDGCNGAECAVDITFDGQSAYELPGIAQVIVEEQGSATSSVYCAGQSLRFNVLHDGSSNTAFGDGHNSPGDTYDDEADICFNWSFDPPIDGVSEVNYSMVQEGGFATPLLTLPDVDQETEYEICIEEVYGPCDAVCSNASITGDRCIEIIVVPFSDEDLPEIIGPREICDDALDNVQYTVLPSNQDDNYDWSVEETGAVIINSNAENTSVVLDLSDHDFSKCIPISGDIECGQVSLELCLSRGSNSLQSLEETLCEGESIEINGNIYDQTNPQGREVLPASNGCDSIINVNIDFLRTAEFDINETLCSDDSIIINGQVYNEENPQGIEILQSSNGCDSIINVNLEFQNTIEVDFNPTLCPGESIEVNGTVYDANNPQGRETTISASGCDSIINVSLMYVEDYEFNLNCTSGPNSITFDWQSDQSIEELEITYTINELDVSMETLSSDTENYSLVGLNQNDQVEFEVVITMDNGCTFRESIMCMAGSVSTDDISNKGYMIYPNPSSDYLNVVGADNADIEILDISNRIVRKTKATESPINISGLNSGLYLIRIDNSVIRFVKI